MLMANGGWNKFFTVETLFSMVFSLLPPISHKLESFQPNVLKLAKSGNSEVLFHM